MVFNFTFQGGKVVDDVTTGAANFSESTSEHRLTVPAGKRWRVLYGAINRDANQTVIVYIYNSAGKALANISGKTAGTGVTFFPDSDAIQLPCILMKAGDTLRFVFGGAQSTAAYVHVRYLEVDV